MASHSLSRRKSERSPGCRRTAGRRAKVLVLGAFLALDIIGGSSFDRECSSWTQNSLALEVAHVAIVPLCLFAQILIDALDTVVSQINGEVGKSGKFSRDRSSQTIAREIEEDGFRFTDGVQQATWNCTRQFVL